LVAWLWVGASGALTGVGATAAIRPVAKKVSEERMTGVEYVKDLALSDTIGAVEVGMSGGGRCGIRSYGKRLSRPSLF
jgi:hypothetical protein